MIRTRKSVRPTLRLQFRPALDRLEDRALMTTAGNLDPTFGGGLGFVIGPITTNVGASLSGISDPTSVAVEPDGSILVAVPDHTADGLSFGVHLLSAEGTLDTSFGTGGTADVALPAGFTAFNSGASALLVESDGQIVVVGTVYANGPSETLVARFNADGTPDSTFGTGGVEVLDPTTLGVAGLTFRYAALQSNGQVVLAGDADALRLTAAGALDPTFGIGGLVAIPQTPNPNSEAQTTDGLAIQPDGQIVVLAVDPIGVSAAAINANPVLIRFNTDGSTDASLSEAGISDSGIDYPDANGLIAEPDGQLLVLGTHTVGLQGNLPALALVNSDGSLATSVPLSGLNTSVISFALQPDGDVALVGYFGVPGGGTFQALRLTPGLTPDLSFGAGGFSTSSVSMTGGPSFSSDSIAVTPNNQIIVSGGDAYEINGAVYPPANYFVARLRSTGTPAVPGDYTGDGISDPTIYLPAYGQFAFVNSSGGPGGIIPFGPAGPGQTIPAPGNYYGDGVEDFAAYLPAYGDYVIKDPTGKTAGINIPFGIPGPGQTIPAPGDYYGTGQDDIAVYLTGAGVFAIQDPTGATSGKFFQFGIPGPGQSIPVLGDYYGTGQDDVAVYLAQAGVWAIQDPTGKTPGELIPFGAPGLGVSIPVPGDYDGSGKTELAVYIPILGELIYRPANGGPDVTIPFGTPGNGNTLPAPGDYDGSGKTEVAAYLPNIGVFAYRSASSGSDVYKAIGVPGPGQTIPVTTVVLSPFPGSGSSDAIEAESVLGEPDALDFLPSAMAKKPKPGDPPTA
jgi:uncharacterized delta-60 repeat protein